MSHIVLQETGISVRLVCPKSLSFTFLVRLILYVFAKDASSK